MSVFIGDKPTLAAGSLASGDWVVVLDTSASSDVRLVQFSGFASLFDAAGLAAAAAAASQPLDADLTAIAALTTTSTGRDLLTSSNAAAIRSKAVIIDPTSVLHVDGTNGSDSTGRPYQTLMAAKTAATSGQTIVVYPGTYTLSGTSHNLAKNGVNWHFMPGTTVQVTDAFSEGTADVNVTGFFDDSSLGTGLNGPLVCKVTGAADFIFAIGTNSNHGHRGIICITNASSNVSIECASISVLGNATQYLYCVAQAAGTLTIKADTIYQVSYNATWWKGGNGYITVDTITAGTGAIVSEPDDSAAGSLWVFCKFLNGPVLSTGSSTTGTAWIIFNEMVGNFLQSNCRLYLLGQKILQSGTSPSALISGKLWINVDKITAQPSADNVNNVSGGYLTLFGGESHITVRQFEDLGICNVNLVGASFGWQGGAIAVLGGTHYIVTDVLDVSTPLQNFTVATAAVLVSAGTLHFTGRVQSTDSNCHGFQVAGGTLIIEKVSVDLTGSVNSIYAASAQNVTSDGSPGGNKTVHANVTLIGVSQILTNLGIGTFPVAANPTASVGLSVVNGSATTFIRSDGAPALAQSIAPTWTAQHIFQAGGASTIKAIVRGVSSQSANLQEWQNSSNTALASLNSDCSKLMLGTGSVYLDASTANQLTLLDSGGTNLARFRAGFCFLGGNPGNVVVNTASSHLELSSTWLLNWTSGVAESTGSDTGLARAAAKVVSVNDGSTAGGTFSSVPLSPVQITTNQDNYNPGVARFYRLNTDASRNVTGLNITPVDGQECFIINVGSQNIVLKHDTTSTAANRFYCSGSVDKTLTPNDVAHLVYDNTSSRWRVF